MMPISVGVMNATPLLPSESSKLNLNGGSFVRYADPENSSAGDRPVEKRPLPERRYFVELSVIYILNNLCSDLRSVDFAPSNVPTIDNRNCACAKEVNKRRKRIG
jgi:hypothetical protein